MALQTLLQVRNAVRSHLDEAPTRQWSDSEINRWINECARDVARRAEVLQTTATIAASIGTRSYTLPSTALRLYRVEWTPTTGGLTLPLEYRDFHSLDSVWRSTPTRTGDPVYYTLWGFPPTITIFVYPVPSVTGSFTTFHYREPVDASADVDLVEIPEGWYDLATVYSEAMALRKDADPRWVEANNLYELRLGELIAHSRRWTDQPDGARDIRVPEGERYAPRPDLARPDLARQDLA